MTAGERPGCDPARHVAGPDDRDAHEPSSTLSIVDVARILPPRARRNLVKQIPGVFSAYGAITVAFAASAGTVLGWLDLEFRWELAAPVVIMLLGISIELYGREPRETTRYDLVVNTGTMALDTCVDIIVQAARVKLGARSDPAP